MNNTAQLITTENPNPETHNPKLKTQDPKHQAQLPAASSVHKKAVALLL
jgi:hypothetical protein